MVLQGERYISAHLSKYSKEKLFDTSAVLTARQREVLKLIAAGLIAKQIADKMGISIGTAHFYRGEIMRKINIHNTAELTRYAMQYGLAN